MSAGDSGPSEVTTPEPEGEGDPSLAKRVDQECERVTRAMAVVDCCLFASESLRVSTDGRPDTNSALEAAYDLLYDATGSLELIVDELSRCPHAGRQGLISEEV